MSRVLLLAADRPLPLCDRQRPRRSTVTVKGKPYTVEYEGGFLVQEHVYYVGAVEALNLAMKPCRYELELEPCEEDLHELLRYLRENLSPGSEIELWNLWVGNDDLGRVPHLRGQLADFDQETLRQFLLPPHCDGGIGQCCMTVVI